MDEDFYVRTQDMIQLAGYVAIAEAFKTPIQTLKGLVPSKYESETKLLLQVQERAKLLRGYQAPRAMLEFVRKCEENSTYSNTLFPVKHQGKASILGVGSTTIALYEPATHVTCFLFCNHCFSKKYLISRMIPYIELAVQAPSCTLFTERIPTRHKSSLPKKLSILKRDMQQWLMNLYKRCLYSIELLTRQV